MTQDELDVIAEYELNTKGYRLKEVPWYSLTRRICETAAKSDGICYRNIPVSYKDEEMLELCTNSYGAALLEADEVFFDRKDLCLKAFECEDTFNALRNTKDTKSRWWIILDNAISICPYLKTIWSMDLDNKESSLLVKAYLKNNLTELDLVLPSLDL